MVAAEADQTYTLTRNPRPIGNAVVGGSATLAGVDGLASGSATGVSAVFLGVGTLMLIHAVRLLRRAPTRITVAEGGMVFAARSYERLVPWASVESVRVSRGRYGGGIRWLLAEPPHIWTAATFANLHRLLAEVERRAPHAEIVD